MESFVSFRGSSFLKPTLDQGSTSETPATFHVGKCAPPQPSGKAITRTPKIPDINLEHLRQVPAEASNRGIRIHAD